MNFRITQSFDADADSVNEAYADPDLYPTLVGLPKLGGIEVLAADGPPVHHLEVRFRFTGELPTAVTAVVDPDRLSWVQESVHDHTARSARFRLVPDYYPERLRCRGRFEVIESGSGAKRTISGELQVRASLLAGRVEKAIISGLEEYLRAEAPAVDRWIAGAT